MIRPPGVSVRWKLALSYAAFLMVAGTLLLAVVWVFLLRYVPPDAAMTAGGFMPGRDDLVRAFAPKAAWALVALLGFGLIGGWILAGRMLAPLDRITAATRRAATGHLSHRIELDGSMDEFRELADAFDTMLTRLEAHVAEQQRFAANASHELRTPLAITQTLLEVARNDPDHDRASLIERLLEVNTRSVEMTEALLLLSRSDQKVFEREPLDLSLIVEEAAETLLPLAEREGVDLQMAVEPALMAGSHALLLQMVMNFLHNGIVHNLDSNGIVKISTTTNAGLVDLSVQNTGASLTPQHVSTLTEPFQRGPGRVRTAHTGVGLGLAIARSICRAHDGELNLAPGVDGGLLVRVRLPAASMSVSQRTGASATQAVRVTPTGATAGRT